MATAFSRFAHVQSSAGILHQGEKFKVSPRNAEIKLLNLLKVIHLKFISVSDLALWTKYLCTYKDFSPLCNNKDIWATIRHDQWPLEANYSGRQI